MSPEGCVTYVSGRSELTKLKRELSKVKQERDFLKDAAVFFAKESK